MEGRSGTDAVRDGSSRHDRSSYGGNRRWRSGICRGWSSSNYRRTKWGSFFNLTYQALYLARGRKSKGWTALGSGVRHSPQGPRGWDGGAAPGWNRKGRSRDDGHLWNESDTGKSLVYRNFLRCFASCYPKLESGSQNSTSTSWTPPYSLPTVTEEGVSGTSVTGSSKE